MTIALLRGLAWMIPALAAGIAVTTAPREPRALGACLLSFTWGLGALPWVNALALRAGWWSFEAEGGLLLGAPFDVQLGWALLWGPVALALGRRAPLVLVVGFALLVDLALMPRLEPLVHLGPGWLVGEAVALTVALVPAQLLGRWTWEGDHLRGRVALHLAQFGLVVGFLLPHAALVHSGGSWEPLLALDARSRWIAAQLAFVAVLPGLSAVLEFAERGGGTPVPFDGPVRLVASGPYAYLRNPMQVATALGFLGLAILLRSWAVAAIALTAVVYGAGFAAWHEQSGDLDARLGPAWRAWRERVPAWLPRWRPHVARPAVLWVACGCDACRSVGAWIAARHPVGLELRDAREHAEVLTRLRYEVPDEGFADEGVGALARSLEHLNLGWALVGFAARLPGPRQLLQVAIDASGGGPRPAR